MSKLCFVSLLACCLVASAGDAIAQTSSTRTSLPSRSNYVYCNVYLDSVCFGITSGDRLQMDIPVDFVLDTVQLRGGAKVDVYAGFNPQDVFDKKSPKRCPAVSDASKCLYLKAADQYDILYGAANAGLLIHVHISGVTPSNKAVVEDFLSGFHACHRAGQSTDCTEEKLFRNLD